MAIATVQRKAETVARIALAIALAFVVAAIGLRGAAFAVDSSEDSASATSASAAQPSGHQSIVYATDEAKGATEQIDDEENALSSGVTSTWSIVDLFCAIANLAFCIALLGDTASRRVEGYVPRSRTIIGAASAVLAFASILVLAMTQDFAMPASVADELSFLFVALLVVQVVLFAVIKLGRKGDSGDVDMPGFAA